MGRRTVAGVVWCGDAYRPHQVDGNTKKKEPPPPTLPPLPCLAIEESRGVVNGGGSPGVYGLVSGCRGCGLGLEILSH